MSSAIVSELRLATGIVRNVNNQWKIVRLPYDYQEMVVVATPSYDETKSGAIVQIRNANPQGSTFEMRVVNPKGGSAEGYFVSYIAVEAGMYENETAGIKIEAFQIDSNFVDRRGSWIGMQLRTYQQYENPVILGQVMSVNDAWSTFWAKESTNADAPLASPAGSHGTNYVVGRHIGEDTNHERGTETIGIIIFEAGKGEINGIRFAAGHTGTVVYGRNKAPFLQPLEMTGLTAVASTASMRGGDGCWPVLWRENGTDPLASGKLALRVDEDQIRDDDQKHIAEKIGYLALNGEKDGARFLAQAGFGGYYDDIHNVSRDGYGAWIDDQKGMSISLTQPYMDDITRIQAQYYAIEYYRDNEDDPLVPSTSDIDQSYPFLFKFPNSGTNAVNFSTIWMRNIVSKPDQLRQRVAWTLSQIMVVSFKNSDRLRDIGRSFANYYDTLATHALGNFRDLLLAVSLHPLMAYYLSSLGNQKASADGSRQPDENYAREVMQLFSIGLWELNIDGTQKLDADGNPILTYDNQDITELARVFTGLWYEGQSFGNGGGFRDRQNGVNRIFNSDPREYKMVDLTPLAMFEEYHDQGEKVLFHGKQWETRIPAGQNGMNDIQNVIDALFNHPNTPPFIARRLIQFLVTSNPSPDYIGRVANKFRDNGDGVRGDMHATVRQVLLDGEARYQPDNRQHGKLLEPMIRLTRAVRAFRAGRGLEPDDFSDPANPVFNDLVFWRSSSEINDFGQWPLYSNSVFNFFEPDYQHGGVLVDGNDNSLYTPEFQIFDTVTATTMANEFTQILDSSLHRSRNDITPEFGFDFSEEIEIAHDSNDLLNRLDVLLTAGQMSDETRNVIKQIVDNMPSDTDAQRLDRVHVAVFGVLVSPDCVVLR